jgi:hypothetical protein
LVAGCRKLVPIPCEDSLGSLIASNVFVLNENDIKSAHQLWLQYINLIKFMEIFINDVMEYSLLNSGNELKVSEFKQKRST